MLENAYNKLEQPASSYNRSNSKSYLEDSPIQVVVLLHMRGDSCLNRIKQMYIGCLNRSGCEI